MTTTRIFTALAIVAAAAALAGGCSEYPGAPDEPTYDAAARPVLMSRCVRCHGSPVQNDPTSELLPPIAKYMGYAPDALRQKPNPAIRFDVYDSGTDFVGAKAEAGAIGLYLGDMAPLPMPPPPAALSNYERDTLIRWSKNPVEN